MQQQFHRPIFSIFDILDRVLDKGIIISAGEQAQSSRHEVERMVTGTRGRLGFSKLFRKCFFAVLAYISMPPIPGGIPPMPALSKPKGPR